MPDVAPLREKENATCTKCTLVETGTVRSTDLVNRNVINRAHLAVQSRQSRLTVCLMVVKTDSADVDCQPVLTPKSDALNTTYSHKLLVKI